MKKQNGHACPGKAQASNNHVIKLQTGEEWVTAKTLQNALTAAMHNASNGAVRFVAGNTSTGNYLITKITNRLSYMKLLLFQSFRDNLSDYTLSLHVQIV